ncbi:MAG TPA: NAD(P)-dependent alcohol dehydrogenase [Casimicrobiaceae bacterium]|nr:NAD(P)-dependent alcohol dehydrogenase [Casimicrobiaceae bacterium]
MRALRFDRYGSSDVLRVEEIGDPIPRAGQAKVRIRAVGLNPLDWKIRSGELRLVPLAKGPPRGLGCDFSGEVVAIGGGATERHVGERVFGSLLPFARDGALAESLVVGYDRILPLPEGVDDAVAAALPIAGGTALQGLADEARVAAGQRVLVTGAAGGVGHFAVQIAKHVGARVVGVCSAANVEFVLKLGADDAVDYAREDFTKRGERFDVVFDAACASSFEASRRVLTESGCYLNTSGTLAAIASTAMSAIVARLTSRRRAIPLALRNGAPMWRRLLQLLVSGAMRPHVERTIALEDVPAALRDMETGHGRGKVVVRLC